MEVCWKRKPIIFSLLCHVYGSVIKFRKIDHWTCFSPNSKTLNSKTQLHQLRQLTWNVCPFQNSAFCQMQEKTEARGLRMSLKIILLWNSRFFFCHWSFNRKLKSHACIFFYFSFFQQFWTFDVSKILLLILSTIGKCRKAERTNRKCRNLSWWKLYQWLQRVDCFRPLARLLFMKHISVETSVIRQMLLTLY